MVTEDEFHVVVAGDASAAGYGNNFNQSYAFQFHELMETVFERLGVKLVTRNMSQRGKEGTTKMSLAGSSLYGPNIDFLVWDAPSTDLDVGDVDFFHRQAFLSGNKIPFLWGGMENELGNLFLDAGADVGMPNWSLKGIPVTTVDEAQVKKLAWATQYLNCENANAEICKSKKFNSACWVNRSDIVPPTVQNRQPSRAQTDKNHGFRMHKFMGRKLAFMMLEALERTLEEWMEKSMMSGYPLADEEWHITDHYNNIRDASEEINDGYCEERMNFLPALCKVSMKGRSEYTPRFDPEKTSISSILTPSPEGTIPSFPVISMLYDGYDLPIASQKVPDDEINVNEIAGKRSFMRRRQSNLIEYNITSATKEENVNTGKGISSDWFLLDQISGYCDGRKTSHCNRNVDSNCLLDGHHDAETVLVGYHTSSWITFKLVGVKAGIFLIAMKIKTKSTNVNKKRLRLKDENFVGTSPFIPQGIELDVLVNENMKTYSASDLDIKHIRKELDIIQFSLDHDTEKKLDYTVGLQLRCTACAERSEIAYLEISHIYWS
mmetsp:Transcript_17528/g.39604  ORF Transcript_17528/g.39604 Transcript_17528/m.39604 type:complete len:549 (-) Transcript_17528:80-1726(-)